MTVLGVGTEWMGDDAAGLAVVRRLEAEPLPALRLLELGGEPARLIDAWAGAGDVVVVDAVRSGRAPGTVHRIDAVAGPLPAALRRASTHHLSVAEAVELARALDRLPRRLVVYGIEGAAFAAGADLSPPVRAAVDAVARELRERAAEGGWDG